MIYTPDRQLDPPKDYWIDNPVEEKQCTICKEHTTDELTLVRMPFRNIIIKEYLCQECLKHHEDSND